MRDLYTLPRRNKNVVMTGSKKDGTDNLENLCPKCHQNEKGSILRDGTETVLCITCAREEFPKEV